MSILKISQLDDQNLDASAFKKPLHLDVELDFLHSQYKSDEEELLKFYFILYKLITKSDVSAAICQKLKTKFEEIEAEINFDKYPKEYLESLFDSPTPEINFIKSLVVK